MATQHTKFPCYYFQQIEKTIYFPPPRHLILFFSGVYNPHLVVKSASGTCLDHVSRAENREPRRPLGATFSPSGRSLGQFSPNACLWAHPAHSSLHRSGQDSTIDHCLVGVDKRHSVLPVFACSGRSFIFPSGPSLGLRLFVTVLLSIRDWRQEISTARLFVRYTFSFASWTFVPVWRLSLKSVLTLNFRSGSIESLVLLSAGRFIPAGSKTGNFRNCYWLRWSSWCYSGGSSRFVRFCVQSCTSNLRSTFIPVAALRCKQLLSCLILSFTVVSACLALRPNHGCCNLVSHAVDSDMRIPARSLSPEGKQACIKPQLLGWSFQMWTWKEISHYNRGYLGFCTVEDQVCHLFLKGTRRRSVWRHHLTDIVWIGIRGAYAAALQKWTWDG